MNTSFVGNSSNFDGVAQIYRWAEYLALGPLLQRTRTHFVSSFGSRKQALVLGDGDGRFLAKLLDQNPTMCALAVDTSGAMLSLLQKRCQRHTDRLQIRHASALAVTPACETDLIVSHFFLDCFRQQQVDFLTQRIGAAIKPGTAWLISDFVVPSQGMLRIPAAIYIRLLYFAFRLCTGLRVKRLPDVESAMGAAHFERVARETFLFGILYTEIWQLQAPLVLCNAQPACDMGPSSNLDEV